jgi:hypothetical protein
MPSRSLVLLFAAVFLALALVTVLVAPRFVPGLRPRSSTATLHLPDLTHVATWIHSSPLGPDSLHHHPVALVLWSDTDPRGLAALPVAEAWYRAYGPLGARVVAVHAPEYAFAADTSVAAGVARRLGLTLPIADDVGAVVEAALGGATDGPHVVVVDELGAVAADTVNDLSAGERALREAAIRMHHGEDLPPLLATGLPEGVRTVPLAAGRVEAGPLRGRAAGQSSVFTAQFRYQESGEPWTPYPVGAWRTGAEGLTATRGGAANFVAIRYSASRAGVVVSPPPGRVARVWILRDDRWPRPDERGEDVTADARGAASVVVSEPRIYWIDQGGGERVLKLSPDQPGVTVHAFVFTGAR